LIDGNRERIVMDQIQAALKIVTDRMSAKGDEGENDEDV
jgi:hypothetical protein